MNEIATSASRAWPRVSLVETRCAQPPRQLQGSRTAIAHNKKRLETKRLRHTLLLLLTLTLTLTLTLRRLLLLLLTTTTAAADATATAAATYY